MEKERNELQSSSVGDNLGMNTAFVFSCPYLGTLEDSETSLAYPAPANYCFRVGSATAIELTHQEGYCLTDQHPGCHVFQMASAAPAVAEAEIPPIVPVKNKLRVSLFALPLILILLVLAAVIWWPAPGTTIQESLVLGAQNDRNVGGGASLNDSPVSQPVVAGEAAGATSSEDAAEPAASVSLNESPGQAEEGRVTSSAPEPANSSAPADQNQASTRADGPTAPDQPAGSERPNGQPSEVVAAAIQSTEEKGAAAVSESSTVGTSSAAVEEESSAETAAAAAVAESSPVVTSTADIDQDASTETTKTAVSNTSDAETASNSADETLEVTGKEITSEEDSAEIAADEKESPAVTTSDLPIISSSISAGTTALEAPAPANASGTLVTLVGPAANSALSLRDSVKEPNTLLVYQGPTSDSALLAPIEERQFVTLLGRDGSGIWLNVRLNNGTEGWVNAIQSGVGIDVSSIPLVGDATAAESPAAAQQVPATTSLPVIRSAYVDTGALNVRSGPGVQYEPITVVNSGEIVGLIGRRALGPWVRVRLDNGLEGWVNSSLLAQIS